MSRYAIVKDNAVENVAEWDGTTLWSPSKENICIKIEDGATADIGYLYDPAEYIFSV